MALALDDHWIWDFWLARDGGDYHLFFLQAPKSIGDPELRHWHASIGHAVSNDLPLDAARRLLRAGAGPAWDDGTTWTGSVIRHGGGGSSTPARRRARTARQRIGLATSTDLHDWRRIGEPGGRPRSRFYEEYDPAIWHDRALRDPWVAPDPAGLASACGSPRGRRRAGRRPRRHRHGALRRSPELASGAAGDAARRLRRMRGAAVFRGRQHAYLLFCTSAGARRRRGREARGKRRGAETGTHYFVAERPAGPWRLAPAPFLLRLALRRPHRRRARREAGVSRHDRPRGRRLTSARSPIRSR